MVGVMLRWSLLIELEAGTWLSVAALKESA